jgi:hypothetical protein
MSTDKTNKLAQNRRKIKINLEYSLLKKLNRMHKKKGLPLKKAF